MAFAPSVGVSRKQWITFSSDVGSPFGVWNMIKGWLQIESIDTASWQHFESAKEWWIALSDYSVPNRKAVASLTLLTSWAIWNDRNARLFRHKSATPFVILALIKEEAALWVAAGAKKLSSIMPGE